ncbi:hypothetical protein ACJMK2_031850 [Sinanodonta woodiana]|uniref:Mitochondria-eating protein C-terminal domain-containing protein n=1 Tax=Sinanodonta woodiana TaxID=1069815 RepID=A0ABD3X1H2_SINWO
MRHVIDTVISLSFRLTSKGQEEQNKDGKKKPQKTMEEKRRNDVSNTTNNSDEKHATDLTNDRNKLHEYERKVGCLEADVIKLREEKNKLLNRNDEVSYTTGTNKSQAKDSANNRKKINEYEKIVESLEVDIIKLTQERDKLLKRNHEVSYTTKTNENHATDSANDREKIHEYERKIERLEADIIKLTQEKSQLLNGRDEVSYKTNSAEIHATDLTKDRNKYDEYKTKVESLEADVMKLRMENETLLKRLTSKGPEEQNEDGKKKPPKTMEKKRRNDVSNKTNNSDEKHATDLTNDGNKLHEYERKVGCLEADVIKLREEKNKLLNRLSEIGAIKLTGNNHKVTDLSDEDRPEKVAEQFSELYDTEWTDAYENLTKIQCKQADWSVKQLLDVLKETYIMCVSSTQEKMKDLKKAISNFLGLTEREATDFDLMETRKRIQEHRKKMLQRNISNIGKEVRAQLKTKLDKEIYECLSDYIEKCVIICWNMCTKEPPMYLDFGDCKQAAHAGDEKAVNMPFDKLKFVTYTKSGDYVDYIVWPAVYIYEGGPLMKKGVAQGSKLITNTMDVMEN